MAVNPCDFCVIEKEQRPAMCLANCLLGPLVEIAQRMRGQDNYCTRDPIYTVQQRHRFYGMDPDYSDDRMVWVDAECNEITDAEEIQKLERGNSDATDCQKVGYWDIWEIVQSFFSEKGAEAYIEANRHRMTDPRIYVDSAYRNPEWKAIQEILVTLGKRNNNEMQDCASKSVEG